MSNKSIFTKLVIVSLPLLTVATISTTHIATISASANSTLILGTASSNEDDGFFGWLKGLFNFGGKSDDEKAKKKSEKEESKKAKSESKAKKKSEKESSKKAKSESKRKNDPKQVQLDALNKWHKETFTKDLNKNYVNEEIDGEMFEKYSLISGYATLGDDLVIVVENSKLEKSGFTKSDIAKAGLNGELASYSGDLSAFDNMDGENNYLKPSKMKHADRYIELK